MCDRKGRRDSLSGEVRSDEFNIQGRVEQLIGVQRTGNEIHFSARGWDEIQY
jgi:hypothetical protein